MPKNSYFHFLLFIVIIFFSQASFALQNADFIEQQDWISRNQQNILDEKKRNLELETIKKNRELKKEEVEKKSRTEKTITEKVKCFAIKEIHLNNAKSLSLSYQQNITKLFLGKCIDQKIITEIIQEVTSSYHKNGHITVQINVPKQNLQDGIFNLDITEGKIEEISLGKDGIREKMQKFTAFGYVKNDILNINEINQGVYQINRLQSNQAVMKIEPGQEVGSSKIIISNDKKFPAYFNLSRDNLGNKFTGIQRTNFAAGLDNLLSLNDNWNVNYTTNLHDKAQVKSFDSFSTSISIPFKYNTFYYDYSKSEFKGQVQGINKTLTSTGFSTQRKFSIERVLLNTLNVRLSTLASLTAKESASYSNNIRQLASERRLSILNLAFTTSYFINDTTNLYLKPSYAKGLKILNATKDAGNLHADNPKAQFDLFKLYASFSKKFTISKYKLPLTFISEMDSQYAKQTVYGSEQFAVGGYYSVRGYRENYITGDSGYYFRNKININLGKLVLPLFNNSSNFFSKNLPYLSHIKLEPFYDYGYVKNKYDGSDGRLSGTGIKSIFESKYFNASLTYSWGLNRSRLITSKEKDDNRMIYFELSARCC